MEYNYRIKTPIITNLKSMPKKTTVTKEGYKFESALRAKNYSERTVSCYISVVKKFLRHFRKTAIRISADAELMFIYKKLLDVF